MWSLGKGENQSDLKTKVFVTFCLQELCTSHTMMVTTGRDWSRVLGKSLRTGSVCTVFANTGTKQLTDPKPVSGLFLRDRRRVLCVSGLFNQLYYWAFKLRALMNKTGVFFWSAPNNGTGFMFLHWKHCLAP